MKKLMVFAVIFAAMNSGLAVAQQMNCQHHNHGPEMVCEEHGENCSHKHGNCNTHNHDCMHDDGKNCQQGQKHGCCAGKGNQQQGNEE